MVDTFYWNGVCSANRDEALFCLFNNETSDLRRYFTITKFDVRPLYPVRAKTSGSTPAYPAIFRTTAQSGGITIPTVKADSSSSSVPSQVLVQLYPDVTTTSPIRNKRLETISVNGISLLTNDNLRTGEFWHSGLTGSNTQKIVLNEGQGIAVTKNGTIQSAVISHTLLYTVTFSIGSATYYAHFTATSGGPVSQGAFGIFNGSGSGVVVEIRDIQVNDFGRQTTTGEHIDQPLVRFVRGYGCDGGESISPLTLDSSTSTPSALSMKRNQPWAPLTITPSTDGVGAGELAYPESNQGIYRKIGMFRRKFTHCDIGMSVDATGDASIGSEFKVQTPVHGMRLQGDSNVTGIVIRPQELFAVIASNPSPYATYYAEIEFTHTAPPTGGGSVEPSFTWAG